MPVPMSQMVDILKDAMIQGVSDALVESITKPAIKQDLYNDVADNQKNEELKQKYFSAKDWLLINDVKASVYNTLCSVSPIHMRRMENAIVAGGCFASLFHVSKPNDYDIFILQEDSNREKLFHFLEEQTHTNHSQWKHNKDVEYLENPNIDSTFTYENITGFHIKLQYIFTKFKTREELLNDFDFVHCCTSMTLDPNDPHLYITPTTYESIRNKVLKNNPKCNRKPKQWRIDKFISRGWKIA